MKKKRGLFIRTLVKEGGVTKEVATKYEGKVFELAQSIASKSRNEGGGDENGDEESSVATTTYQKIAFEKLAELIVAKDDVVLTKKILKDISSQKIGWCSSIFEDQRNKYEQMLVKAVQKPVPVRGVYQCRWKGCKSDFFYTWSVQKRSADEGMTQMRECGMCGKRNQC